MLTMIIYSGTTGYPATNRIASATAAANPSYPPAVCEHGDDPSIAAPRSRIQSASTPDAEHVSPTRLPVPKSDATTAADECPHGCSYTTVITSP